MKPFDYMLDAFLWAKEKAVGPCSCLYLAPTNDMRVQRITYRIALDDYDKWNIPSTFLLK